MAERPRIRPLLLASLTSAAPARLVRKLDKTPDLAESWTWAREGAQTLVTTPNDERVSLEGTELAEASQLSCSCLLAPRCLHLLAVASRLDVALEQDASSEEPPSVERAVLTSAQEAAARHLHEASARILAVGANATGAIAHAELLRGVHACRVAGLHRASGAGVRVARALRDLREKSATFALEDLHQDMHELLWVTHLLGHAGPADEVDPDWIGTARRRYSPEGNLRLYGLVAEAVVGTSGHAGVVTYVCDAALRLYAIHDVQPGPPERARSAYQAGEFAGVSLGAQELCRAGLFVNGATASSGGRLGRGGGVNAVRATGVGWAQEPLAQLFERPIAAQIEAQRQQAASAPAARQEGDDLVFVDAELLGATRAALVLRSGELVFHGYVASPHPTLSYRENLSVLARAPGLPLRLIGRLRLDRPRALDLLALSSPELTLPEPWQGCVQLGLDRMTHGMLPASNRSAADTRHAPAAALWDETQRAPTDPLAALRRRTLRVTLGGRGTLPEGAQKEVEREASRLEAQLMPTGASLFRDLLQAARGEERGFSGERVVSDAAFTRAWLRAVAYERQASQELARAAWLDTFS